MPIHKLIEAGGEQYLPYALSKLRRLAKLAARSGSAVNNTLVDDGTLIQLKVNGAYQYLRITGGSVRYEFFTSDQIYTDTLTSPGFDVDMSGMGYTKGSLTLATPGGSKTPIPVHSDTLPSTDSKWRTSMADEGTFSKTVGSGNQEPGKGYPIVHGGYGNQNYVAYTNWPNNGSDQLVTSPQGMTPGINSTAGFCSAYTNNRLANTIAFHVSYDTAGAPTHYDKLGSRTGAPMLEDKVFLRHAAVQTVGARKFFIHGDSIGRFQVYPVSDYARDVPESFRELVKNEQFKEVMPPYPSWVTTPSPDSETVVTATWLWAFDKKAERCVSCPFNSVPGEFRKFGPGRTVGNVYLPENAMMPAGEGGLFTTPIMTREDTPGLVEFGIEIRIDGPGTMEFTPIFTLLRSNYSGDANGRFVFDAAYTLKDQGQNKKMGVPEDTLVTAEMEVFTVPGGYDVGPIAAPNNAPLLGPESIHAVARYMAFFVINAFEDKETLEAKEVYRIRCSGGFGYRFLTATGQRQGVMPGFDSNRYYGSSFYDRQPGPVDYILNGVLSGREFDLTQPADTAGARLFFLLGLELRTLSLSYSMLDQELGKSFNELIVYNSRYRFREFPFGQARTGERADYSEKVPTSATPIYMNERDTILDYQPGIGFVIHPAGHFSYCPNSTAQLDDVVQAKGRAPTTHRTLFNKAFGEMREARTYYDQFWNPVDRGFRERNQIVIGPGQINYNDFDFRDVGSFRTAGYWITF